MNLFMVSMNVDRYKAPQVLNNALEMWLLSLYMIKDVVVSSFIFWTLGIFSLFSSLTEHVCPTFSIHNMLVYRQPGHTSRANEDEIEHDIEDSSESDYSDA